MLHENDYQYVCLVQKLNIYVFPLYFVCGSCLPMCAKRLSSFACTVYDIGSETEVKDTTRSSFTARNRIIIIIKCSNSNNNKNTFDFQYKCIRLQEICCSMHVGVFLDLSVNVGWRLNVTRLIFIVTHMNSVSYCLNFIYLFSFFFVK